MIRVSLYHNKDGVCSGFSVTGHAGYAEMGADIVCAAVSVLMLNTVNAVDALTDAGFSCEADEKEGGFLSFHFKKADLVPQDAKLLIDAMVLGLRDLEKEYKGYLKITDQIERQV